MKTFLVIVLSLSVAKAIPADMLVPGQPEQPTTLKRVSRQVSNSEKRRLYEEALEKCTQDGDLMPFYNATQEKYLCYKLLEQGPCEDKQWVALDQRLVRFGLYFARCFDKKCQNELVETKNECQAIYGVKSCPPGMHILVNPFGKGECGCKPGFLSHVNERGFVSCYQEYLQGPCQEGQQYILPTTDLENPDSEATCVPTDCPANQVRYKNVCIPVSACAQPTEIVVFNAEDLSSKCEEDFGLRGLIDTVDQCKENQIKNLRNKCVDVRTPDNINRRSVITYGHVRNLRAYIINRRRFG